MEAEQQLDEFLAKYLPETELLARNLHSRMREIWPGAIEMVYDNYNFLVIGFGPNDRPSSAVLSLAVAPKWVSICFLQGASLTDPYGLFRGEGNQVRSIRIFAIEDFDDPRVQDLIQIALSSAQVVPIPGAKNELTIRSISAKQRPRRPRLRLELAFEEPAGLSELRFSPCQSGTDLLEILG